MGAPVPLPRVCVPGLAAAPKAEVEAKAAPGPLAQCGHGQMGARHGPHKEATP